MNKKRLSEVSPGDIIASDVFLHNSLLVKKGTKVTRELKDKLKKLNIKELPIKTDIEEVSDNTPKINYKQNKPITQKNRRTLFYELLKEVFSEARYGFALNSLNNISFLEQTFMTIFDEKTERLFLQLKEWDYYSFIHSFDVFVLGTMLSKSLSLDDYHSFVKGCLLHDIGKLNIPQSILQKEGKLTQFEYEQVKKHVEEGSKILSSLSMPGTVIKLAKSHHERLGGSGYLEQLSGNKVDIELKLIMIIDVYSALTLDRSYRIAQSSIQAIEYLLQNLQMFDEAMIRLLCNTLKIYPKGTKVLLSTNKPANILYVNNNKPYLPLIKEETENVYELPNDFSIRIEKLIDFNVETKNNVKRQNRDWGYFLSYLIKGNREKALFYFEILADDMVVEDIYTNIFSKAMNHIGELWINNEITIAEEHIVSVVIREIMDIKLPYYENTHSTKGNIVLLTVGTEQHKIPLKIVSDCLSANGWKTYNLENTLPVNDLIEFIKKHKIEYIGFSATMPENLPLLKRLIRVLEDKIPNTTILVGGRAIEENLDEFSTCIYGKNAKEIVQVLNKHYNLKINNK